MLGDETPRGRLRLMNDSTKNRAGILNTPKLAIAAAILFLVLPFHADAFQSSPDQSQGGMPGMDMGKPGAVQGASAEAAKGADMAMSGHDMDMGPHMFMTDLRPENAGDQKRAAEIVAELKT